MRSADFILTGNFDAKSSNRLSSFAQEDRTIGELEDTWIACLEALCRRLRILISKAYNDRGYIPRKTEAAGLPYSEAPTTERTTEVTSSQDAQVSSYTAPPSHPAPPNAATILPKRSDERYYASPTAADINGSTGPAGDKHIPGSFSIDERDVGVRDVTADDEEAGRKYHGFMARVSFNKTLVRAGARVPWGRGKAGRFAKARKKERQAYQNIILSRVVSLFLFALYRNTMRVCSPF